MATKLSEFSRKIDFTMEIDRLLTPNKIVRKIYSRKKLAHHFQNVGDPDCSMTSRRLSFRLINELYPTGFWLSVKNPVHTIWLQ